ncbi:MAG: carbonyl reductase 1 [Solirubrobacteraceae bacterium]|nr:carbonyl reductase 1 [Solirubrobacteraceae bacterium]
MNRVALVTGATKGLGLALVDALAAQLDGGDIVYLTGRSQSRIEAARASLTPARARVLTEPMDVACDEAVAETAARLADRHGSLDIVISNAYSRVLPGDRVTEVVDGYVATNNLGTTRVLRAFPPILSDGGTLLVVASALGTLHYLAPVLHERFDELETLEDVDASVIRWKEAVEDGSAFAEAWPAFVNIPSKIGQVSAVRTLARHRRASDLKRGILLASVAPGLFDTGASRPWFDMSNAQTAAEAAVPLVDLALRSSLDQSMYGELVAPGRVLPWKP